MSVYVVAECGINHNGCIETAKAMIHAAKDAGANAVKFQKRDLVTTIPRHKWHIPKDTPWGKMDYIDYKRRLELDLPAFQAIDAVCREIDIEWYVSCWDVPSVEFIEAHFSVPFHKVASPCLTNLPLLKAIAASRRPVMLSTGMSTQAEVCAAYAALQPLPGSALLHTVSCYPCAATDVHLRQLSALREWAATMDGEHVGPPGPRVGYSGHEQGIAISLAAVAMGAEIIERHFTLDPSSWGSDQKASISPAELNCLVTGIREIEAAQGTAGFGPRECELPSLRALRHG